MQPILDQEKLFFELTKTLMNDKDLSLLNYIQMSDTTKKAFEFMRKLLSSNGTEEVKLLIMYAQTCKVEMVIQQIIKKMQNELYSNNSQQVNQANSQSSIVHNYIKNVIIHTHQNILYFLEIATLLMGGSALVSQSSKLTSMRQNIEISLQSLQSICRYKRDTEFFFNELYTILKRLEVMKVSIATLNL